MTRLGELVEINPRVERASKPYSFIAIADIDAELGVAQPGGIARRNVPYRVARPGDVLFARISPSMENGKVAIVPELETDEALVSTDLLVLRAKPAVDPRLVWAFLRQQRIRTALKAFTIGSSGRQRLRSEVLEKLEISVPDEQSWGMKIRVLEHLGEARRLRRVFGERVRILAASAAASLASGAPLAPLGSLEVELHSGTTEFSAEPGPVQVLRATNVVEGRIDRVNTRFLGGSPEQRPNLLRKGDLLVARAASSPDRIGRCAVYEDERQPTSYAASLLNVRSEHRDPDFLWAWLQSAEARAAITKASRRPSGRYRLTVDAMAGVPIPRVGEGDEARAGELARLARRLAGFGDAQAALLDRAVQAHLASTFGGAYADQRVEAEPQRAPAEILLPHVFEAASDRQQQLWRRVSELSEGFGLTDLAHAEADHAWLQHCLAIFEQLGLVVRESIDESYRWRQPDLELEVLG